MMKEAVVQNKRDSVLNPIEFRKKKLVLMLFLVMKRQYYMRWLVQYDERKNSWADSSETGFSSPFPLWTYIHSLGYSKKKNNLDAEVGNPHSSPPLTKSCIRAWTIHTLPNMKCMGYWFPCVQVTSSLKCITLVSVRLRRANGTNFPIKSNILPRLKVLNNRILETDFLDNFNLITSTKINSPRY